MEIKKIIFRVDGSQNIGLGHLIRCIALGDMLKNDFKIFFVSIEAPQSTIDEINNSGFYFIKINSDEEIFKIIRKENIVVLDSYKLSTEYQKKIKEIGCKLVCIDDLHDKVFFADLIINHAPGIKESDYRAQKYTRFALNEEHVLLRPSFLEQAQKKSQLPFKKETVLICFGGLDYKNLSLVTLLTVLEFIEFKRVILITGTYYPFYKTIESIIKNDNRIEYYHAIDENTMVELMKKADLAIVPSSGVLLEALAVGPVVISGMYVDNQKLLFNRYKDCGAFISAGYFSNNEIKSAIKYYFSNIKENTVLFDGLSSKRLLNKFLSFVTNLRIATYDDCLLFFDWVNDYQVRSNAINKEIITWENHERWFNSKIDVEYACLFVLELFGKPIGQIRYEKKENFWIIDYSIDIEYRGRGYGKTILEKSLLNFKGEKVKAYVLPDNLASSKVFESMKFNKEGVESINSVRCDVYTLKIK